MSVSQCQDYHLNISSNLHHFYEEEVVPHEEDLFLSNAEQRWNKGLICKHCGKCVAIEGENHLWVGIEEILGSQGQAGWREAVSPHDRWLQTILNNVVYYLNEAPDPTQNESDYCLPCEDDKILLCYDSGSAVGFCTLKCKGKNVPGSNMEKYTVDIVDSIFIRKSHRRKGLATGLLQNLNNCYHDENIGFSSPLSNGMKKVLISFLSMHSDRRDNFWLCIDDGDVGNRNNIWMMKNLL